jgi:hypothetical protein
MIEMYCDYHTPTIRYVRHDGVWFIMPAKAGGWTERWEWTPSPAVEKSIAQPENRCNLSCYRPPMAEQVFGIPQDVWRAAFPDGLQ